LTTTGPPPGAGGASDSSTDSEQAIRKGIAFSAESTVDGLLARTLEEACLLTASERGALAAQAGTSLENARLVDVLRSTVTALEHSRDKQKAERELAVHRLERITVLRRREEEILAMLRHNLLTARASIFAETDSARSALREIDTGLERCAERLRRAESHLGADGPAVEEFRAVAREL